MFENLSKTKVVLSAVDASKAIWVDTGILHIDMITVEGKKTLKIEVHLIDLNNDHYARVKLKTPPLWAKATSCLITGCLQAAIRN